MGYFRDVFTKLFLGTKATTANANQVLGFIVTANLGTDVLQRNTGVASTTYGVGSWGLFLPTTWKSVTNSSLSTNHPNLVLAAASLQLVDSIGAHHGGYMESNKSKEINPKLITRFLRIDPCTARQHTLHVGSTNYTETLSPTNSDCSFEFLCGETYNLRIEIRNDPALQFIQHNIIRMLEFNGGCCAEGAQAEPVDGTLAMIEWANQIVRDPQLKDFITPIVYSEAGVAHYPPGTESVPYTWDNYVSPGHVDGQYAGMRLQGAYVETKFGNCSFQKNDGYDVVPIEIFATMVDFNGAPCEFTGICVVTECPPLQGNGFGETVLRDMILSESYRQNKFPTDQRIREIEQGNDILDAIDRETLYTRYVIQHHIPRHNNPSGSYSQDQYELQIITNGTVAQFETIMATWLTNAKSNVSLETTSCTSCSTLTP